MDKREYLKSYRLQYAKIQRLEQMAKQIPEEAENFNAQIIECKKTRKDIENKIGNVENELQKEVLFQKYVYGKTHEEIGVSLNYSSRHIERIHKSAIENIKI